jgi:hypothetical protein
MKITTWIKISMFCGLFFFHPAAILIWFITVSILIVKPEFFKTT